MSRPCVLFVFDEDGWIRNNIIYYDVPSKTAKTTGGHETDIKEKILCAADICTARTAFSGLNFVFEIWAHFIIKAQIFSDCFSEQFVRVGPGCFFCHVFVKNEVSLFHARSK